MKHCMCYCARVTPVADQALSVGFQNNNTELGLITKPHFEILWLVCVYIYFIRFIM